jgi:hypothetical protein
MAIKVCIDVVAKGTPDVTSFIVKMPAVPMKGDYLSHDVFGFSGYVHSVTYWWDEKGELSITLRVVV